MHIHEFGSLSYRFDRRYKDPFDSDKPERFKKGQEQEKERLIAWTSGIIVRAAKDRHDEAWVTKVTQERFQELPYPLLGKVVGFLKMQDVSDKINHKCSEELQSEGYLSFDLEQAQKGIDMISKSLIGLSVQCSDMSEITVFGSS